jgi:hypothetical protein
MDGDLSGFTDAITCFGRQPSTSSGSDRRPRESLMIEWGSANWGRPGHNAHHADNGSWWGVEDEREE